MRCSKAKKLMFSYLDDKLSYYVLSGDGGNKIIAMESYVHIYKGEVFVSGMNISPYEMGNIFNRDPLRERKLLLSKREINKMIGKCKEQGYTIIPTKVYFKGRLVKVEIALAKGKKLYDKRESTAKRDADRRERIAEKGNY